MSSEPSSGSYWSGYDLLWNLRAPAPTRRTSIDRGQIVAAAIEIADRDGLAGVTMRSVADALGSGPMSLYRHVPDKDALVSMMVDAAIAASADGQHGKARPTGWRDELQRLADATWLLCRRHRWFPEASIVRPPITPSGIAGFEYGLSIFDDVALDIGTKARFVSVVFATVISCALHATIEEVARARVRMTADEVHAAGAPFVRRIIASGNFPRVSAFIIEAEHLDDEAQMRASVELILDGIATRLDSVPAQRAGT